MDLDNIGGYLQRVNEKGVDPIWECRPNCDAMQSPGQNLLDSINAHELEGSHESDLS
jgi:hypothetical protein